MSSACSAWENFCFGHNFFSTNRSEEVTWPLLQLFTWVTLVENISCSEALSPQFLKLLSVLYVAKYVPLSEFTTGARWRGTEHSWEGLKWRALLSQFLKRTQNNTESLADSVRCSAPRQRELAIVFVRFLVPVFWNLTFGSTKSRIQRFHSSRKSQIQEREFSEVRHEEASGFTRSDSDSSTKPEVRCEVIELVVKRAEKSS